MSAAPGGALGGGAASGAAGAARLEAAFLARAAERPEALALVDAAGAETSYRALERASADWAGRLRAGGVGPGDRVGVEIPKSAAAVGALLGALRCGAAYVPIDAAAPAARRAAIAADAALRARVFAAAGGAAVEFLPGAAAGPEWAQAAYILYTSGSTGVPKGVVLSHAHARNFTAWAAAATGLGPDARVASHAPFHFDLSVYDLWAGLGSGAAVCLLDATTARFPRALTAWIVGRGITHWYSVPSALVGLEAERATVAAAGRLRQVMFAGEVFPPASLERWRRALPRAAFHNWYGPTETNVCTHFRLAPWAEGGGPAPQPLPIGAACPGFELRVGDAEARPRPAGAVGYLWAAGEVLLGYWGDPARTAAVTRRRGERRWYNTGDLVVEAAPGVYEFRGRRDHLVKCRGYRVSLLEVERALEACPGVRRAVVVARPSPAAARSLAAYVETGDGAGAGASAAGLRRELAQRLPAYMLPDPIELRAALPLTSTGKLDRRRLQAGRRPPAPRAPQGRPRPAARTERG